jgi:hypothetical protein
LDDVQSNPTQGICLFCRVRFQKELNIFAWFYVKSIFFRTSFRILSRVEVIYDFRFIKELEFYFKGNVSNKMVV